MKIVLVDTNWKKFLPVSFTRPVSQLRCGILKINEKWEKHLGSDSVAISEEYLNKKYFQDFEGSALIINSKVLPCQELVQRIKALRNKEVLTIGGTWLAIKSESGFTQDSWKDSKPVSYDGEATFVEAWWDLYKHNGQEIENDFKILTEGRETQRLSASNNLIGSIDKVFIEEGAYIEGCTLNTQLGSIYIGKHTEVMEGSMIRGSFSILDHSKIKLGAKIYGPTSIGPKCKIGGEVKNSVIQGFSNKSHDGYLGNSVLGEWVNLGADTNCSNLKNTFSNAKVWDYETNNLKNSEEMFIGCCIGDYSKTGINTMINTASVIGVNANVFGSGFAEKRVSSFTWGANEAYLFNKAWETNCNIARMVDEDLEQVDKLILKKIHEMD